MSKRSDFSLLRARIATMEWEGGEKPAAVASLGVVAMDGVLPGGGLALGCLHEITPVQHGDGIDDGGGVAFCAAIMGRLAARAAKPVLWIGTGDMPYAPGLAALGLGCDRVVTVRPYRAAQTLWALEEGVRCRALAGVLAETWDVDQIAARRLQLAARASGVPAVILNHGRSTGVAVTRWRVGSAPSRMAPELGVGPWRWNVELLRCRGRGVDDDGRVAAWKVEWDEEARGFRLAAPAADRAVAPAGVRATA